MTLFNVSAGTVLEVPADGSIHEYLVTGDFAGTPNGLLQFLRITQAAR
jgi:hypothetical protein